MFGLPSFSFLTSDASIPFSTRSTTLERIATVMEIDPEGFEEYKIPQEPLLLDDSIEFLRQKQDEKGISTVQLLKSFPRKKIIDIMN